MKKKLLQALLVMLGMVVGYGVIWLLNLIWQAITGMDLRIVLLDWAWGLICVAGIIVFGIVFFVFSPGLADHILSGLKKIEAKIAEMPAMDIFFGVLGLIVGLLLALLLSTLVDVIRIPAVVIFLKVALYLVLGCSGWSLAVKRRSEFSGWNVFSRSGREKGKNAAAAPKVLDTSVIIDGRIYDICGTGILEGTIVVPEFVLRELRHIADSADPFKRARGRRGLDVLNRMQKELGQTIRVESRDYEDVSEVDVKLLKLAGDLSGVVVTNDYNLNRVAGVQNVPVLNINDLANAVKPILLPGETVQLQIVKPGKEADQGVGYLNDGTMIVVEGGRAFLGETVQVTVSSVLQTSAGRMIFAKACAKTVNDEQAVK